MSAGIRLVHVTLLAEFIVYSPYSSLQPSVFLCARHWGKSRMLWLHSELSTSVSSHLALKTSDVPMFACLYTVQLF